MTIQGSLVHSVNFEYDAFISYRTSKSPDMQVAEALQTVLETFPIPNGLKNNIVRAGRFRPRLTIFRDSTDLAVTPDLTAALKERLERSRFLIVVCTPQLLDSPNCLEEIRYFRSLYGNARILTLLAEGDPHTSFPSVLTDLSTSPQISASDDFRPPPVPLAADVRAESLKAVLRRLKGKGMDKSRQPRFKLIAPLLGCKSPDELIQRDKERVRRQQRIYGGLTFGLPLLLSGYFYDQYRREQVREGIKQLAQVMQWADAAKLHLKNNPIQAALIAAESLRFSIEHKLPTIHAERAMREVLSRCPSRTYVPSGDWARPKNGEDFKHRELTELPGLGFAGVGSDEIIRVWNLSTDDTIEIDRPTGSIYALLGLPDGRLVGALEGKIVIWSFPQDGKPVWKSFECSNPIYTLQLLADGRVVAQGGDEIQIWDVRLGRAESQKSLPNKPKHFNGVYVIRNSRLIVSTLKAYPEKPALYLWDLSHSEVEGPMVLNGDCDNWTEVADGRIAIVQSRQNKDGKFYSTLSLWLPNEPSSALNPYVVEDNLSIVTSIAESHSIFDSTDDQFLLVGTRDSKVIRWNLKNLPRTDGTDPAPKDIRKEWVLPHEGGVTSLLYVNSVLVTGGEDGTVRTTVGAVIRHEKVQNDQTVHGIRSIGGNHIVSEGPDGIRLFPIGSNDQSDNIRLSILAPPKNKDEFVIKKSPEGIDVFMSDAPYSKNGLRVRDLGEIPPTYLKPTSWSVMSSGEVVVAFPHGIITVWNPSGGDATIEHGARLHCPPAFLKLASAARVSENKILTSIGPDTLLWSVNKTVSSATVVRPVAAPKEISKNGQDDLESMFPQRIAVHSERWVVKSGLKQIFVWDMKSPATMEPIILPGFSLTPTAFSEGRLVSLTSTDIRIWNLHDDNPLAKPVVLPVSNLSELSKLCFLSADCFACTHGGEITVWRLGAEANEKWEMVCNFNSEQFARSDLEFLVGTLFTALLPLNKNRLAVGCGDGTLIVWKLDFDKEPPRVLRGHYGMVHSLVSLDGDRIASASQDGNVLIWDLSRPGSEPLKLVAPVGKSTSLLALANKRLACRLLDGSVHVWDLGTDKPQLTQLVLPGSPTASTIDAQLPEMQILLGGDLLIASAEDKLACSDAGGIVRIWDLDCDRLLHRASRSAGRNLSRDEWDKFFSGRTYRTTFSELKNIDAQDFPKK